MFSPRIVPGNGVKSVSVVSGLTGITIAPWTNNRQIVHPYSIYFLKGRRVFYYASDGVACDALSLDQCFALLNNVFISALGGFLEVPVVVQPFLPSGVVDELV